MGQEFLSFSCSASRFCAASSASRACYYHICTQFLQMQMTFKTFLWLRTDFNTWWNDYVSYSSLGWFPVSIGVMHGALFVLKSIWDPEWHCHKVSGCYKDIEQPFVTHSYVTVRVAAAQTEKIKHIHIEKKVSFNSYVEIERKNLKCPQCYWIHINTHSTQLAPFGGCSNSSNLITV